VTLVVLVLVGAISGCGHGHGPMAPAGTGRTASGIAPLPAVHARDGGTITYLAGDDVDSLDPGRAYQPYSWGIDYAVHRPLYSYAPDDIAPRPDLAAGPPVISQRGRTVTVRLRDDVRFAPPVNRLVVSADVRYALERGFTTSVQTPYLQAYLGALRGLRAFTAGRTPHIAGIVTPDARTIVLHLEQPTGYLVARALSLPVSSPVPRAFARRYDRHATSQYDRHMVATGPYEVVEYHPGVSVVLARNPNWRRKTDYRRAPADRIVVHFDSGDPTVTARQILATRRTLDGGGLDLPPALKAEVARAHPHQYELLDTGAYAYVALSPRVPPFDNINVRRAVAAGLDRKALRQQQGGPLAGPIATHFLAPSIRGFDEAGGAHGFGFDFLAAPSGDYALARRYFRRAGYPSGRPTNAPEIPLPVLSTSRGIDEALGAQLKALGFRVRFKLVGFQTEFKLCSDPVSKIPMCLSTWLKDFDDGYTTLDVPFTKDGLGGFNYSRYVDPQVGAELRRANSITEPAARARAMAAVDRLITGHVLGVPIFWTTMMIVHGPGVTALHNRHNQSWDLSFSGRS
jgi:peptide/nickel transport system substrate-binding protein